MKTQLRQWGLLALAPIAGTVLQAQTTQPTTLAACQALVFI